MSFVKKELTREEAQELIKEYGFVASYIPTQKLTLG